MEEEEDIEDAAAMVSIEDHPCIQGVTLHMIVLLSKEKGDRVLAVARIAWNQGV